MHPRRRDQPIDWHLFEHGWHHHRPLIATWIVVLWPDLVRVVLEPGPDLLEPVGFLAVMGGQLGWKRAGSPSPQCRNEHPARSAVLPAPFAHQ